MKDKWKKMKDKRKNIDTRIREACNHQDRVGGIDTKKLPPGTIVYAHTRNSIYILEFLNEKGRCLVEGGKYFTTPTETDFIGSNFGGSVMKMGWIGHKMRMEIINPNKDNAVLVTTAVRSTRLVGLDWEYEMEWPD